MNMKTYSKKPRELVPSSQYAQKYYGALNHLPFITRSKKYCVTISDEHKFVWYRVAKVGTRTVYFTLKEAGIDLSVEHALDVYVPSGYFEEYFKFAFVRNPFDRLVSCWLSKVVKKNKKIRFGADVDTWERMQDFSGFISFVETLDLSSCDVHLRSQSSLIDLTTIDFIGRMESFEADFAEVLSIIGIPAQKLETRNVSKARASYQDYYNDDDIERVYKLYKRDCQIFGYSFGQK